MFLFIISAIFLIFSALPYLYYLFGIKFGKRSSPVIVLDEEHLPPVTIVISAYNEEKIIAERLDNLIRGGYPPEKYELIFIDDSSSDRTKEIAESKLADSGIDYRIFSNETRKGTNRSYNFALGEAKYDIVVTTDANKFFEKNALQILISRLVSAHAAAILASETRREIRPFGESAKERVGGMEGVYRNFYGRMCDWESANDSTYNFNGALVAFKKDIIVSIKENKGADDANTAFEAIRKGYRAVYVMESVIYEKIPPNLHRQYKQKVRRAKRLIEATLSNLDLLGSKRIFSRRFYPARIMIYISSPFLFLAGTVLLLISLILFNAAAGVILIAVLLIFVYVRKSSFISSFILNQAYLFLGLLNIRKDMRTWESTSV